MFRLNEKINHWNKQTQYKKQFKQFFLDVFLSFLAIARNASPLSYAIHSKEEAQVDGTKNVF